MNIVESGPVAIREIENAWIPMPDGAKLAARLWLPEDAERNPVPAIVEYIPYRKRDGTAWRDGIMQPYIAGHGYAVLRIDLRGSGDSDGVLRDEYTSQEHDDGMAALAWIAAQPWCSGRIGMIGMSWGGFNALQMAARRPPSLAAIVTICASDDRYTDDAHYMGGAVLSEHAVWGVAILAQSALPPDPEIVGSGWREMWRERLESTPRWVAEWLRHQRRDAYWRYGSISEDYAAIRCPVYAIGGWADAYRNAVPRLLARLSAPSKGLIGPWAHGWPLLGEPGPAIGLLQELLRWWDKWLKGIETGIMDEPRYRVWMQQSTPRRANRDMQPGRWVAEPEWPSPTIVPRRLHLNAGRLGTVPEAEGTLSHASPHYAGRASGSWCPYSTGSDLDGDQRVDDGASLVFDSLPLQAGFDILGAPELELELAVDRPQATVIARLCDVDETGASARVTYGVLNLTHRDSHAEPTPLEPGRRYRVRLALNDVAYAFPAGHRVRLALSTSYWPIIWPSPAPATVTVFTGAGVLSLPERPASAADAALRPFGEPEGAKPPPMTTSAPGSRSCVWSYDVANDRAEFAIDSDSGIERFDWFGLDAHSKTSKRYRIAGDDPLTAEASLAWTIERQRAAWRVRIEAEIEMRCSAEAFFVRQSLAAYEGDACVFSRDWDDEIGRDLV